MPSSPCPLLLTGSFAVFIFVLLTEDCIYSVMQMVISGVRCNDLMEPLKKLAIERQKLKGKGVNRSHSLYWDILFLAFTVMGRENIDHGKGI